LPADGLIPTHFLRKSNAEFDGTACGRWPVIQKILDSFEEIGMYLMDVSPVNIAFAD